MPAFGYKSYLQLGKEGTFGTKPTFLSHRLELISANIQPVAGQIPDPSLNNARSRRAIYEGAKVYRGNLVFRMNYDGGLMELARNLFSGYSSATVESGVVDHTMKEGTTEVSHSLELGIGDMPAGKVFLLTGVKVPRIVVRATAGQGAEAMLQAEVGVFARDMQSDQTPTKAIADIGTLTIPASPTHNTITRATGSFVTDGVKVGMVISNTFFPTGAYVTIVAATTLTISTFSTDGASHTGQTVSFYGALPTLAPVLYHQAITVDDGQDTLSESVRVRSFDITMEAPRAEDRFYMSSKNPDEAIPNEFVAMRWQMVEEFLSKKTFDAIRNYPATAPSPKLLFQHPDTIGASSKREFELRAGSAEYVDWSAPVEGYGIVLSTVTMEGFQDPTDLAATVMRFRNTDAALA